MTHVPRNPNSPPQSFFSVQFGDGDTVFFQEVDGINSETMASEYRHGNSPGFYPINMPGIGRVGNVTLRNGIFSNDNRFWRLHDEIELNATPKRTIFVNLLDESGNPTMTWTLNHARPTRMSGVDVKVEGIEVAVESIEVAYETFAVVLVSSP